LAERLLKRVREQQTERERHWLSCRPLPTSVAESTTDTDLDRWNGAQLVRRCRGMESSRRFARSIRVRATLPAA
jgi:hypothetical protein